MKRFESKYLYIKGIKTNAKPIINAQELLQHVEYIQSRWDTNNLWFRGLSRGSYNLMPSIYRKNIWMYDPENAKEIYTEFLRRATPFIKTQSGYTNWSKWEWYHLMQHYGVPTRLLDWTEGALIALFFALRRIDHVDVPCVWVLEPKWLNKVSTRKEILYYSDPSYQEKIDKKVMKYLDDEAKLPDYPVAVLPALIDHRIVAQKAVYTIHGKKKNGYLELSKRYRNAQILKLQIDSKAANNIRDQLGAAGVTETTLFPDLEGLAREIRWDYDMR